jgi:phosphatidylserine/phosphatidylglycerophosphate/cardiolipin synthase-like enzyme
MPFPVDGNDLCSSVIMAAEPITLFQPGRNCYRTALAQRAALLVDGEEYFRAFAHAALRARHSIVIIGWDFHSRTRLHVDLPGVPDLLGDFLNFLARRTRRLRIFILTWDYPLVFAKGREPPVGSMDGWQPHRRISFHYDGNCPVRAALHQKFVVIDSAVAFCGGMDLTVGRWDTAAHAWADPRRTNVGETEPYGPVHDTMLVVDAGAARVLHGVASERWQAATGSVLPAPDDRSDPWPDRVMPALSDVRVALSRTVPAWIGTQAITEVETLYLDMIATAKHSIYIENQYFTAKKLGDALAARLAERDGPEVIAVLRLASSGRVEEPTMTALRSALLRKLREADAYGRFRAWYPDMPGQPCCDVHSKLMIVDDEWLRVGSANFANRSMGLDTECDLTLEAGADPAKRSAIAAVRDILLGEHLDLAPQEMRDTFTFTGSLRATIETFAGRRGRTLRPFVHLDAPSSTMLALATGVADPECPPITTDELTARVSTESRVIAARPGRFSRAVRAIDTFLSGTVLAARRLVRRRTASVEHTRFPMTAGPDQRE